MRYAGEFKLAGGNVDAGETLGEAAERELTEEFLRPLGMAPAGGINLRPFIVKQTRPVKGRSNLMYNYVALESENAWLASFDVDAVNASLVERKREFHRMESSGEYYGLSKAEKELVSPEVHQLRWITLRDAIQMMFGSMLNNVQHVNAFQAEEFGVHGVKRRDPMFITVASVIELEGFPTEASLIEWCNKQDLPALAKEEQWLFNGQAPEEVDKITMARMKGNGGLNPSMKSGPQIQKLRAARTQEAKRDAKL